MFANQNMRYNNGVMADPAMVNLQMNNMAMRGQTGTMGMGMGMGMGFGMGNRIISNGMLLLRGNCMTV